MRPHGNIELTMRHHPVIALLAAALVASPILAQPAAKSEQRFPDVVSVKVLAHGQDTFDFDVTVSSPYDTSQRYADGIRVLGRNNEVLGERKLFHDHADEQPFTRDLNGVKVPLSLRTVVVQARDQKYGYGGKSVQVVLPGR
jgi:hypothetical protein